MATEWKLVPVEPTPEIFRASSHQEWDAFESDWKRQVAAAPVQQAEPVEGAVWHDGSVSLIKRGAEDDYCARHPDTHRLYLHPPAAPVQQAEPVAYLNTRYCSLHHAESCVSVAMDRGELMPLYLHPPAAEVQRLVDALTEIADTSWAPLRLRQIARAALEGVKP